MKKRFLAMFLALVICLGLTVPAFAAEPEFEMDGTVLRAYNGPGGDVVIPNGVTEIGSAAFAGCSDLRSVTIPESVTNIGNSAFAACKGLTSVTIPGSVAAIGDSAFFDCTGLKDVTFSKGVTTIGEFAFQDCTGLTSVGIIPDSMTSIKDGAFSCCWSLTAIQVDPGNQVYASVDGVLFTKDLKTVVICPCGKQGAYSIPDSVTVIGNSAFEECTGLTSVTVPGGVTSIGVMAFFDCEQLKDVYYGGSEAQWKAISIDAAYSGNDSLISTTIHYNSTGPDQTQQPTTPTAANPTNDKLSVDGKDATPAAYKIDNANYFKLRDVAMLLNGTKGQFSIDYSNGNIYIVTGQPYAPIGGELGNPPTQSATAETSNDTVYINGEQVELAAYKIGGANFYGIRDLGRKLGFNVGWAPERGMFIESDKPYTDAD